MNDFDRHLESRLRILLDPITRTPAPPRKGARPLLEETRKLELILVAPVGVPVAVEVFA